MPFTWTIVALVVLLAIAWRFLGSYMVAVYEGRARWLSFVERPIYRVREPAVDGAGGAGGISRSRGLFDREILHTPWSMPCGSSTRGPRSATR